MLNSRSVVFGNMSRSGLESGAGDLLYGEGCERYFMQGFLTGKPGQAVLIYNMLVHNTYYKKPLKITLNEKALPGENICRF